MKIITIDSKAYQKLQQQIDKIRVDSKACQKMQEQIDYIANFIYNLENPKIDRWVDNEEAMKLLGISRRTLQRLRTDGVIAFGMLKGKCRYKLFEVERVIEELIVPSSSNAFTEWKEKLGKK